ncbi:prepilin peptidase [Cryobacterium sp. W22_MBD10_FK3]|uniref:prepilin peptidase n=1 Tax=Cryobacterium sp. W22_MBD10_FK3 TaxID=3240273 RepID=UPI003F8ED68C
MISATALIALFGALIGSFLNVVAYRVPKRISVVSPPSACTQCGVRIKGYDNIPVLSWCLLRGKCRNCKSAISVRYPLIELGTAIFFALVASWVFSGGISMRWRETLTVGIVATAAVLLAYLYLAAISVALTVIDIETHTLPNSIVVPAYPVSVVLLTAAGFLGGEPGRVLGALVGGIAMFGMYLLLALASRGGMGLGDVKLAGVLGLYLGWLGWGPLAVGAFGAFLLGGLFSVMLIITRRANRKSGIPFGPWMLAGAWLGILGGRDIANWYLALFGLA